MRVKVAIISLLIALSLACQQATARRPAALQDKPQPAPQLKLAPAVESLVKAARAQAGVTLTYDPAYTVIAYPNGDVPREKGVCTDVIVRAFRDGANLDLQKEVHEDMKSNFKVYPKKWGLKKTDPNIDHRRVPNLMTFFTRKGKALPVTTNSADYKPGDIVAWDMGGGITHIGLVSSEWDETVGRYKITHNVGWGVAIEDRLHDWKIIGHYRYF
jgi:hypothetical protein